jgi:hypothetical protein
MFGLPVLCRHAKGLPEWPQRPCGDSQPTQPVATQPIYGAHYVEKKGVSTGSQAHDFLSLIQGTNINTRPDVSSWGPIPETIPETFGVSPLSTYLLHPGARFEPAINEFLTVVAVVQEVSQYHLTPAVLRSLDEEGETLLVVKNRHQH